MSKNNKPKVIEEVFAITYTNTAMIRSHCDSLSKTDDRTLDFDPKTNILETTVGLILFVPGGLPKLITSEFEGQIIKFHDRVYLESYQYGWIVHNHLAERTSTYFGLDKLDPALQMIQDIIKLYKIKTDIDVHSLYQKATKKIKKKEVKSEIKIEDLLA